MGAAEAGALATVELEAALEGLFRCRKYTTPQTPASASAAIPTISGVRPEEAAGSALVLSYARMPWLMKSRVGTEVVADAAARGAESSFATATTGCFDRSGSWTGVAQFAIESVLADSVWL